MKKYEIKEKNNFKLFPKKLFGLPRLFGFALFGFAQHPCISIKYRVHRKLRLYYTIAFSWTFPDFELKKVSINEFLLYKLYCESANRINNSLLI